MKYIIGFGGFAREVLPLDNFDGFVDLVKSEYNHDGNIIKIITENELENNSEIVIAIGDPHTRSTIASRLHNYNFINVFASTSIRYQNVQFGFGCIMCHGSCITCDCVIGNHVIFNLNSTVGHDCNIGSFVTVSPGAHISGNCKIGNNCYIGTGAVLREGITICDNVVIGANACVVKDITVPGVYVGVPAKLRSY